MMIDNASFYLFSYTSKPDQKFEQKSFKQNSCDNFNVGRSTLPMRQHCIFVNVTGAIWTNCVQVFCIKV